MQLSLKDVFFAAKLYLCGSQPLEVVVFYVSLVKAGKLSEELLFGNYTFRH